MTLAEIRKWVQQNLEEKAKEFGAPHWRIDVFYEHEVDSDSGLMRVTCDPGYEMASITIIWPRYESLPFEKFVSDFEHELLHIAHSPFEIFLKDVLAKVPDESEENRIRALFNACAEMTVRNLERTTYGLRNCAPAPRPKEETLDAA